MKIWDSVYLWSNLHLAYFDLFIKKVKNLLYIKGFNHEYTQTIWCIFEECQAGFQPGTLVLLGADSNHSATLLQLAFILSPLVLFAI